ncbi:MAG TPA: hypothetical protein VFH11_10895, partial [Gemmatimonadota bacterium]|nr:hypothetical protein [Gemmatimonadota bacterium]
PPWRRAARSGTREPACGSAAPRGQVAMMPRFRAIWFAALLLAACQGAVEEAAAPAPPAADRPVQAPSFEGEEPTGEAIFAWLNAERYRETWELLPGTLPLHSGAEPHGALLTTYANPLALEAIERAALSMPPGAAIAVEDHLADSTLSTISVMVRLTDPDPESGEWHFGRFGSAGEVEAGPMDSCRSCHVLEPDLVFGWELGTSLPIDSTGATASSGAAP